MAYKKTRNDMASQRNNRATVATIAQIMGIPFASIEARYDEADHLIDLALSHLGLTYLPPEIGHLTPLERLYLNENQLTALPPEIGQLANLTLLGLNGNRLRSLPPEVGQLARLTLLDLRNNPLGSLPAEIAQLNNCYIQMK